MGWFTHINGVLRCVRCGVSRENLIQTKLLRSDSETYHLTYGVGDSEIIDGLEDYLPLNPWIAASPLVVAVGDWNCHCGLAWQWAKVTFETWRIEGVLHGLIKEVSTLLPNRHTLQDIHYVEGDLAELSGFWDSGPSINWKQGRARWNAESIESRLLALEKGFGDWCREVAKIDLGE